MDSAPSQRIMPRPQTLYPELRYIRREIPGIPSGGPSLLGIIPLVLRLLVDLPLTIEDILHDLARGLRLP